MKNEYQGVSPELAQEMKELGVKQDSVWYWTWAQWNEEVEWVLIQQDKIPRLKKECFSTYTVAELGEMLPYASFSMKLDITKTKNPSWFCDIGLLYPRSYANTEADARAKCLIYIYKKGILTHDK